MSLGMFKLRQHSSEYLVETLFQVSNASIISRTQTSKELYDLEERNNIHLNTFNKTYFPLSFKIY